QRGARAVRRWRRDPDRAHRHRDQQHRGADLVPCDLREPRERPPHRRNAMTIEQLPGEIVVPTRDTLIEQWKRSHRLRVPDADTGVGTQPDVDARVAADALMPVYAAA